MTSVRFAQGRWYIFAVLVIATTMLLAGTAAAQDGSGGAPAAKSDGGMFDFVAHFFKSLGIPGIIVLGAISICMVALIVMLLLDLRTSAVVPTGFVEEFTDTVNKRQFKQAFDLARADSSFLGRVLTAGMSRLQYGLEDGTVYGMIKAFMALNKPDASIDPKALAEGISHALCMTLAGVGLALPAIFFNAFFKNRIMHVAMDCGNIADDLLTQMYHNSKKPAPPGTPATGPTVAAAPNGPGAPTGVTPTKPV
jgi:biopolymer transport protein ExbB